MRMPLTVIATAAVVATLVGVSVPAAAPSSKSSTPSSGSGAPPRPIVDYTPLLIKAGDINAPDPFTAGPATKDPNGQQGALITFSDQDHSHAIIDTIQILPDAEADRHALGSAKASTVKLFGEGTERRSRGWRRRRFRGCRRTTPRELRCWCSPRATRWSPWSSKARPLHWHRRNSSLMSARSKMTRSKKA